MEEMLRTENLSYTYTPAGENEEAVQALQDINLSVKN